ncbi:MAG: methionine ABC transporter ATP-binding protein [Erysipelotrichia bacterium]|nr:methionine ABC transporter ATP-binding protein [Erysipelotrichia bacterium]
MIEISNLSKTYSNEVEALKNVNLKICDGDIYGIIGLSGAGKSTLVRCIDLLEKPSSGTIKIDDIDLTALNDKQLRGKRKEISLIFQNFNLLEQKTCLQNVLFPLTLGSHDKKQAIQKGMDLLSLVGLQDKANSYPSQLSGGQKQRVAIARALATDPKVLLCDEPTSALDPQTTTSILQLLSDINKKMHITIIIITHQMSVVESICNKVAILSAGTVAENGKVDEVFSNPQSNAAKKMVFPEGFDDIINRKEQKKFIRVVFDGEILTERPIIAEMTTQTQTLTSIFYASTKSINGKVYGSMLLSVQNQEQTDKVLDYLHSNGLIAKEVVFNA